MTSPHHKGPQHQWTDDDRKKALELAFIGADLEYLAKMFHVTKGAMVQFCKRNGIIIQGYGRSPRNQISKNDDNTIVNA